MNMETTMKTSKAIKGDEDRNSIDASIESPLNALARSPYFNAGEFGFTNDEEAIKGVRQYVADATADSWSIEPTYASESVDRAAHLRRAGFVMSIIARDDRDVKGRRFMFSAQVNIWGPDGLAITPPRFYDFEEIKARARVCNNCGARDVGTQRFSFAGRCCAKCLPAMQAEHEKPGWCN